MFCECNIDLMLFIRFSLHSDLIIFKSLQPLWLSLETYVSTDLSLSLSNKPFKFSMSTRLKLYSKQFFSSRKHFQCFFLVFPYFSLYYASRLKYCALTCIHGRLFFLFFCKHTRNFVISGNCCCYFRILSSFFGLLPTTETKRSSRIAGVFTAAHHKR